MMTAAGLAVLIAPAAAVFGVTRLMPRRVPLSWACAVLYAAGVLGAAAAQASRCPDLVRGSAGAGLTAVAVYLWDRQGCGQGTLQWCTATGQTARARLARLRGGPRA